MFGRMFAHLPPLDVPDSKLQALAAAMLDPNPDDGTLGNDNIPAGFTYLGQFVDHDITLNLTSLSDKKRDPLGMENFRPPAQVGRASCRDRVWRYVKHSVGAVALKKK